MKAVHFTRTGDPDVLKYVDIDRPSPGPDQVLIKVEAAGVNYADILVRQGAVPTTPFPVIPGEEYSGIIETVGQDVTDFESGQRVAVLLGHGTDSGHVSGGYADYAVAETRSVIPIPDEISFDTAAATFGNYLTAYLLLHTANVQPGQTILLYAAAGGGGTAMIQLAELAGIHVIGLTSSDERAKYVKSQGAMHVINYNNEDITRSIMNITHNIGVDTVFNTAGGDTIARDFDLLAPFGQVIWYGTAAGLPSSDIAQLLINGFHKHNGIKTFLLHAILQHKPTLWKESIDTILTYLVEGKIKPHIHQRIELAQAHKAHELLGTSQVFGKLLLKPKNP